MYTTAAPKPHSRLPAIVLCYLTYVLRFGSALVGKLHGSVELPCVHHNLPGPIEEITVYWQLRKLPKDLVVAAVMNGVVDTMYVDYLFRGRAHLNPDGLQAGNFNLNLTNLLLNDSGTYTCIILWSPSYISIINNTTVELEVTAEFSTPVVDIPSPGNLLYGQELTLTCTSQGGLEQPRIMWINISDGSELQDGHVQQVVHQDEDVINVTSTITLNVTSNIYILCVILTKNGNLTSQHYKMELPQKETSHVLTVTVITGGLVGVLLTAILVVTLRHTRHTPSYEAPTNQMSELGRS